MRKSFIVFVILMMWHKVYAQIPTTCFEIQSILVSACGTNAGGNEGENEMVRFIVGPNSLNTSNLNVNWPNGANLFLGICQNAQTASKVATINASILGCGLVVEPTAGVLPAGSKVLLVTSTNMSPSYNSFANLSDTLYILFQCPGNISGHFKNYGTNPPLTRTLSMNFGAGCADAVTYRIDFLVDQSGQQGSAEGSTVLFDFGGNATYINQGCQAPFIPLTAALSSSSNNICTGDNINLTAVISNTSYSSFFWSGGAGVIGNSTSLNTSYQTSNTFVGNDLIKFGIVTICGDTVYSNLTLTINSIGNLSIFPAGVVSFCQDSNVTLSAQLTGALQTTYQWSTGSSSNSINVNTANTYTVTATNICGITSVSQTVTEIPKTPVTITYSSDTTFCKGDSVTLFAIGGGPYVWSTGSAGNSVVVNANGLITVTGNPLCGTKLAQQIITVIDSAKASIIGNNVICPGVEVQLTAAGGDSYQWSSGETTEVIMVAIDGVYILTATNICGSDTASIQLVKSNLAVSFVADTLSGGAPLPVSFISNITNANSYLWNFGDGGISSEKDPTHVFASGGLYTVILSVEDQYGCTDTYSDDIDVIDETNVFVPTAFTPDGDGLNDIFIIKGAGIIGITTTIFNRWGQAINVNTNINQGWDGTDRNQQPEPEGIYCYLANIKLTNGDTKKLRGSVLLLR